jgi:hypothetical protein
MRSRGSHRRRGWSRRCYWARRWSWGTQRRHERVRRGDGYRLRCGRYGRRCRGLRLHTRTWRSPWRQRRGGPRRCHWARRWSWGTQRRHERVRRGDGYRLRRGRYGRRCRGLRLHMRTWRSPWRQRRGGPRRCHWARRWSRGTQRRHERVRRGDGYRFRRGRYGRLCRGLRLHMRSRGSQRRCGGPRRYHWARRWSRGTQRLHELGAATATGFGAGGRAGVAGTAATSFLAGAVATAFLAVGLCAGDVAALAFPAGALATAFLPVRLACRRFGRLGLPGRRPGDHLLGGWFACRRFGSFGPPGRRLGGGRLALVLLRWGAARIVETPG